jgi:hypothetical protein
VGEVAGVKEAEGTDARCQKTGREGASGGLGFSPGKKKESGRRTSRSRLLRPGSSSGYMAVQPPSSFRTSHCHADIVRERLRQGELGPEYPPQIISKPLCITLFLVENRPELLEKGPSHPVDLESAKPNVRELSQVNQSAILDRPARRGRR